MKNNAFTKLLVAAFLTIGVCTLLVSLAHAGTITDNFDGASLNTHLWRPFQNPQTQWVQKGGELKIKIGAGASSEEGAGLNSRFRLKGDFEMTVDYRLILWPPANGVRLGFEGPGFSADDYTEFMIKRISRGADEQPNPTKEVYAADFKENLTWSGKDVETTDDHGTLKLTRAGSVLTGYFSKDGGPWTLIRYHDYSTPTGLPEWVAVTLWATGTPTTNVEIAFDNFQVSYNQVEFISDLSPLTLLLLD